jgi:hypothetical protein
MTQSMTVPMTAIGLCSDDEAYVNFSAGSNNARAQLSIAISVERRFAEEASLTAN